MKLKQLAFAGLLLLLLTLAWLGTPTVTKLLEERSTAASIRANLVATQIAQQIEIALRMGVPLAQLEGIDELFSQHCKRHPDIRSITFMDAGGTLLHRYSLTETSEGALAKAEIHDASRLRGRIELRYAASSNARLLIEIAALITAVSVLGGILSMLCLQYAAETGPFARDRATARLCQAILAGQTDIRLAGFRGRDFDKRPQWLSRRLRNLHESRTRLTRMLNSLTATEPSAEGRARLLALGQNTEARFATANPSSKRLTVISADALRNYPFLLLGAALAALRFPLLSGDSAWPILGLSWLLLGAGLWQAQRLFAADTRWARFSPIGYLVIAVIALIPIPFFLRLGAASIVAIALLLTLGRSDSNSLRSLIVGEIIGLLAGALLIRLSPEAPSFFSAGAALIGMIVSRSHPPATPSEFSALPRSEESAPALREFSTRKLLAFSAVIGAGFSLALATGALRDFSFISTLALTAALIAATSTPATGRIALTQILASLALAAALFCLISPLENAPLWLTPIVAWLSIRASLRVFNDSCPIVGAHTFWIALAAGAFLAMSGTIAGIPDIGLLALAAGGALALSLGGRFWPGGL